MADPDSEAEFLTPLQRFYLERNNEASQRTSVEIENRSIREMRGGIGLIIASMLILSPLASIIQILMIWSREPLTIGDNPSPATTSFAIAVLAVFAVSSIFVGWNLAYRRVRRSVIIAIGFIAITGFLPVIAAFAMGVSTAGLQSGFAFAVVWISYLLISKRVKAIYSPDPEAMARAFD